MFKAIILTLILSVGFHCYQSLKKMDCFKIKQVIVRYSDNEPQHHTPGRAKDMADIAIFSYLKGSNIFEINLSKEAKVIQGAYPSYKKVRLIRFAPDLLIVDFIERKPLACIKSTRLFYIDETLTLFEPSKEQPQELDLPQITGLEKKVFAVKYGSRLYIPEAVLALDIIKKVQFNKQLEEDKIKEVDVASLSNASIFILIGSDLLSYTNKGQLSDREEYLEVRIGESNIQHKIEILSIMLRQLKHNLGNIKYIDLRFKEPLISYKQ